MEHEYLEYDEDNEKACMWYDGGTFSIFLNRDRFIAFCDSLFWMSTTTEEGEEFGLWTGDCAGVTTPCPGAVVGFCEFHLIRSEPRMLDWLRQNGKMVFSGTYDRVDVYLNRDEFKDLYQQARACTEENTIRVLTSMTIHLVPDSTFG